MDFEALGKRIRQQRKLMKMTQEQLAVAAEVSTSYIGHIERGIKRCSLETLVAIANTLKITPDQLLQDSLESSMVGGVPGISDKTRSMLNEIASILRDYE